MNLEKSGLLILAAFNILFLSCGQKRYAEALSPRESIKHFELMPGFSIEPFATEPNVLSPVDMVFDEQGTVYVLEMADYPYKPEPGKGRGRIRVLRDTDNDGKIDTAIVFADGLPSATSMLPWKGGLIVTAAPDIVYLKDTTADFRSDTKEVLFTGFFANNSEAQITSLRFGIDNWIYANNNGQEGEIHFLRKPGMPPVNVGGSDFRFRLDKGLFEKVAGSGQFGMAIDDWGHRFYTQNTLHIQQAPIGWKYLHRHAFLPSDNADEDISGHTSVVFQKTPPPYWRKERSDRRQKDYDESKLDRKEYAEGHFTGASGGTFYGGDAFPESYYGSVFTGDVAGNLVHRDVLVAGSDDPAFIARRAGSEMDREFLASTDPWFRPVNFTVGPDGYLYLLDMYRQHIETPVSIPDDLKKDMDFNNGENYGRIYRIFPAGASAKKAVIPNLRNEKPDKLVALLAHPNQWWRLQAQQLILERQDTAVIPLLQKMFTGNKDPKARIHALYALEGLDALTEADVRTALKDPQPGIREQAIILSERYPACLPQVLEMIKDSSVQVVLQASLSLGNYSGPAVVQALANVIRQYGSRPLFRKAVLSSETGSSTAILQLLLKQGLFLKDSNPGAVEFVNWFAYITGARNKKEEIVALRELLSDPAVKSEKKIQAAFGEGLANGLKQEQ
ncbi:PVC-type heme-binding CxxCH protein [Flavihumibacter profundi]|uniref:PVC-type heme-binding CxxCH protein n=1 Tax=Flavihumibacter profundi TaxID=2716883 RepID=UPI001CC555A1|nr:PVC-type heme-binding CxxCH protein [Flavihumibacter profundi]MBZ5859392.1 dehydrogenase [Flavihumibacter profundi]